MLKCELSSLEYKGDLVLEGLDFNDNLGYLLKFKKINTPSNSYCVDCEVSLVIPRKKTTIYMFTYSFVNSTDMGFYEFVESVKGRVLNKFSGNIETIQKFLDIYSIQNTRKSINIDTVYAKPKIEVNVEKEPVESEQKINLEDIKSLEDLRKAFCPDKMSFDEFMKAKGVNLDDIFKFEMPESEEDEVEGFEDLGGEKEERTSEFTTFPEFLKMLGFEPEKVKKVETEDIEKALKTGAETLLTGLLKGLDKIVQEDEMRKSEPKTEPEIKVNRHLKSEKSPLEKEGDKMYAWLSESGYTNTNNEYLFIHYCRQYLFAVGVRDVRIANYLIQYCLNKFRNE